MKGCTYSTRQLQVWLDGEAGREAPSIAAHVEHCPTCKKHVETWRRTGDTLRALVDAGVGEPDSLAALQAIRRRIAAQDQRSWWQRVRDGWNDLWAYNRQAVAGVAVAAAIGALSAPAVLWWRDTHHVTSTAPGDPKLASVVVESMEYDSNATAAVLHSRDGSTTLIWMEPKAKSKAKTPAKH